jgi:hypothetical protein
MKEGSAMGVENDEVAMVRAALAEHLELARRGITPERVLGYPTATILFAFIDAVGSYHRDVASFMVRVDGADLRITQPEHHMRILNSDYFGLNLTAEQINRLYRLTRSPLTHNGLVGAGTSLWPGEPGAAAIEVTNGLLNVRLAGLLTLCERAFERFSAEADTIVPNSAPIRELREKEASYEAEIRKAMAQIGSLGPLESMQASAMGGAGGTMRWRVRK